MLLAHVDERQDSYRFICRRYCCGAQRTLHGNTLRQPKLVDRQIAQHGEKREAKRQGEPTWRAANEDCANGGGASGWRARQVFVGLLRRVSPRSHRRYQPIAAARNIRDISRVLCVIAQQPSQGSHGLIHRSRRDHQPRPDLIKQLLNAHHLTCVFRQAHEELHLPALELDGVPVSRHRVQGWIDPPGADAKNRGVFWDRWRHGLMTRRATIPASTVPTSLSRRFLGLDAIPLYINYLYMV